MDDKAVSQKIVSATFRLNNYVATIIARMEVDSSSSGVLGGRIMAVISITTNSEALEPKSRKW